MQALGIIGTEHTGRKVTELTSFGKQLYKSATEDWWDSISI